MGKIVPGPQGAEKKELQKHAQVFPAVVISFIDVQNAAHAFVLNAPRARELSQAIQATLLENGLTQSEPS